MVAADPPARAARRGRAAPLIPKEIDLNQTLPARPLRLAAPAPTNGPSAVPSAGADADRRRAIDEIRRMNPTATVEFLEGFGLMSLRDYVEHLRHARQKHVRLPGWVQRRTMRLAEARQQLRKAS